MTYADESGTHSRTIIINNIKDCIQRGIEIGIVYVNIASSVYDLYLLIG